MLGFQLKTAITRSTWAGPNGDQCSGAWKISVADEERDCLGKTVAIPRLAPGQVVVRANGRIDHAPRRDERVVTITPGKIDDCSLTLE